MVRFCVRLIARTILPMVFIVAMACVLAALAPLILVATIAIYAWQMVKAAIPRSSGHLDPVGQRQDKSSEIETDCIKLSVQAYSNPRQGIFRYVDTFWLEGGVLGWIVEPSESTVFVVFRGTSEIGNWFLTNARADMVEAKSVLSGSPEAGRLHAGFVKAFQDLWCEEQLKRDLQLFWKKHLYFNLFCAAILFLFAVLLPFEPMYRILVTLIGALAIFFVQLEVAEGRFEQFFVRKNKLVLGPSLRRELEALLRANSKKTKVVFTGHSLGGALATLAFADFCAADPRPYIDIELVTFGSPQVGNESFSSWLTSQSQGKFSILANRGDPVVHLPPSTGFLSRVLEKTTLLGVLLAAVYVIVWRPYSFFYDINLGSEWAQIVTWRGAGWLRRPRPPAPTAR